MKRHAGTGHHLPALGGWFDNIDENVLMEEER